jgi:hypothetical protein
MHLILWHTNSRGRKNSHKILYQISGKGCREVYGSLSEKNEEKNDTEKIQRGWQPPPPPLFYFELITNNFQMLQSEGNVQNSPLFVNRMNSKHYAAVFKGTTVSVIMSDKKVISLTRQDLIDLIRVCLV